MKPFLILLLAVTTIRAEYSSLPAISLYPERELGRRGWGSFQNVVWSTDCEWFDKPAPVCRVAEKPMDLSRFHEMAKAYDMKPFWNELAEEELGPREEGAFSYRGDVKNRIQLSASGSPKRRTFHIAVKPYRYYERDENQKPVVAPLPSKEEAVTIAREWMQKLGIDENELYRKGDGPQGFDVLFRTDVIRSRDPVTQQPRVYPYGMTLNFSQQIGGLPAHWHGFGGSITCKIADGSEFSVLHGTLTGWEKIGDYPVLNREQLTRALQERFFWVFDPISCESVEVIFLQLSAYHARTDETQTDFPLVYFMRCKLHGGRDDGEIRNLLIPALVQHRNRYGPPPELSEQDLELETGKPPVILPREDE